MNLNDTYLSWLSDAHSMEANMVTTLEEHIKDAGQFPELSAGLTMHLDQTRHHAELIKGCLDRLGGSTSELKTGVGKIAGAAKGFMNSTYHDEVVRNTIDDFVAENLEIASYTSLIAAAEALGDVETAQICKIVLREEELAEALVRRQLPVVSQAALRGAAEATA